MGKSNSVINGKKYVIIAGASIENLGAESMTCIAINRARELVPGCTVILASTDKKGMQGQVWYEVVNYDFPTIYSKHAITLFELFLKKYNGESQDKHYENILENTKYILDISGYSFTTKFGIESIFSYLNRLRCARKFNIPYYIYSQSFGPVCCRTKFESIVVSYYARKEFKHAHIIEVRETCGVEMLNKIGIKNAVYKPDMVLLYRDTIDYSVLRKKKVENTINSWDESKKRVAIVPNEKIINMTMRGKNYVEILNSIIDYMVQTGYDVYLVAHCKLDLELCDELIKSNADEVKFIDCTNLGSALFDSIVKKMNFIVASRYHAIVHAYRNYIPALTLGWEGKYNELLKIMGQEKYLVDCREELKESEVLNKLNVLIENEKEESMILEKNLKNIRNTYE